MSMTFTFDPDLIYAMLKEYHDAVMNNMLPDTNIREVYLAILQDDDVKHKGSPNCSVSAVPGGAKIDCFTHHVTGEEYTANGAAYRFTSDMGTYELFRVSFPPVTKGPHDTLTVYVTAVLTVG